MLLHVIETPRGIDLTFDSRAHGDAFVDDVQHGAVLDSIQNLEDIAIAQAAAIERLAARCRVERRPVQNNECTASERAGFDNGSREPEKGAVVIVETIG